MAWQFLPPHIDLEAASVSFNMPARSTLMKSSVASVRTSEAAASTVFRLTLGRAAFQFEFRPNLVVNLPAPLADMGLGGIEVDLKSGVISPRIWFEGAGIPLGHDVVEARVRGFMRDLITSTPLAIPPYDPSEDPDLILTARQILSNLQGESSSAARDVSLSAALVFQQEIQGEAGGGGFRVPAGAKMNIAVDLEGPAADVQRSPKVRKVTVECSSLVLRKGGSDQAELTKVTVSHGGAVQVEGVRGLGDVGAAAAGESLIRLFNVIVGGGGIDPRRLQPRAIEGLLRKEVESALRPALAQWVRDNAAIASGVNLGDALGIAV